MSEILEQPFDYDALDEEARGLVVRKTHEIHGLMRRTAEDIIMIGENLLMVQQYLPEMKFSAWLRAEFDLSRQSAYNFMKVATKFGGSCKTVLQLPARVLYELASSSDAIVEQVEAGQLLPTLDAIRAAKEAERRVRVEAQAARQELSAAHAEVQARQATIEQLTGDLERLQRRLAEMSAPWIEIREVEKPVVPAEITGQLDTLRQKIATLTQQRDALSKQVSELQEQARADASERLEGEHERRVRLNWYRITSEFQRSMRAMLSQWPSPLDVEGFGADEWARLSLVSELARRFLEECSGLNRGSGRRIVDGSRVSSEDTSLEQDAHSQEA